MALTPEQQAQVEIQTAVEDVRHANQLQLQVRQNRLEAIRLAKETLLENARSKPVNERDVTVADITAFADSLMTAINA